MATWKAGNYMNSGLSKSAYTARQSAPRRSSSNSSSKSPAPLVGAGPLLPGQTRASSFAGPSLPGRVQPGYYDYSNNSVKLEDGSRTRTRKTKSSSSSKPTSIYTNQRSLANSARNTPNNTPTKNTNGTVQRPVGMGQFSKGQYANGAGGYSFGGGGSIIGGGQSAPGIDASLTGTGDNENWLSQLNPFNVPTAEASGFDMAPNPYQQSSLSGPQSSMSNITPSATYMGERPSYTGGMTGMGGDLPQQRAPQTQTDGGVAEQYSQGYAGGQKFDNSGYKDTMKAQKKALDELVKSIKSQYAQSTIEGTKALDASKQQDLLKLSGLFNFGANQDPNSEQRIQYEQRTQGDYAGQLKDFLAKLSQGQAKDISGAQQGYQSSLAGIMQQQAQARQAYQQQLADQENMMWDRNYKMQALKNRGGANPKNMSLKAIGFDKFGTENMWVDQSTGDIYDQGSFQ